MLMASYNIHKGVLGLRKRRLTIHALRERLHELNPDLVFLQEVQGEHTRHARRFNDWPVEPQHEFLARHHFIPDSTQLSPHQSVYHSAYGLNAFYRHGHHGNALLSRYPIDWRMNRDVSDHVLEQRGILHCLLNTPQGAVHGLVVHFGLFAGSRRRQLEQLIRHVRQTVPPYAPLLIAGDFNDWQGHLTHPLEQSLGVREVFNDVLPQGVAGALSFPVGKPRLRLDRIYQRGFVVNHAQVLTGPRWEGLSDHAPVLVDLDLKTPGS